MVSNVKGRGTHVLATSLCGETPADGCQPFPRRFGGGRLLSGDLTQTLLFSQ